MILETETETRLRRTKDLLTQAKLDEDHLRKMLYIAEQKTKQMRERYAELFAKNEREHVARIKAMA